MRAVFLIGSYVPHQETSINSLIDFYNVEIHSYSLSKNFTYIPKRKHNFIPYKFTDYRKQDVFNKIVEIDPAFVVVAGWMIPDYIWICKRLKKVKNIPIIGLSDTPWYGTLRQKINALVSPIHLKKCFTHLWVAGIRQYDYARKLGFSNQEIILNSLSADTQKFNQIDIEKKSISFPKNFIFIGRYTEIKGLKNLIIAWTSIQEKKGWTFTLIGAGEMEKDLKDNGNFIVKEFMSQEKLLHEMQNSGCFVLPSLKEPWALVIHEAAAAGLPILCTETCGASSHFVINDYNGYRVQNDSAEDLKRKMELIINSSHEKLLGFSNRSRNLSRSIDPLIQASSLMEIIDGKEQN